jgi:CDP-glucose 4,6-dehydratase
LSGYLWLAACLLGGSPSIEPASICTAFNFGPSHESNRTVLELVHEVLKHWPGRWEDRSDHSAVHESSRLQLSTDKANALLAWTPVWNFSQAIEATMTWYRQVTDNPASAPTLTASQIAQYVAEAGRRRLAWAAG